MPPGPNGLQSRLGGDARQANGVHPPPNADYTGTRPRPMPDQNGMPQPGGVPNGVPSAERTGTRPRPEQPGMAANGIPSAERTGTRPRPEQPGIAQGGMPSAERTGTRPRPMPDQNGMPQPGADLNGIPTAERTGTRPRPEQPGVVRPGGDGMPGAERTGTRPRPEQPGMAANGIPGAERTGTRPRPMPDQNGMPQPGIDPNGIPTAERTGTRPRPMPDQNGMPSAERTGTRPRPMPDQNGVPQPGIDPNGIPAGDRTGTRQRPMPDGMPQPGVDANGIPTAERTGTRPRVIRPGGGDPAAAQPGMARPGADQAAMAAGTAERTGTRPRPNPDQPAQPGMPGEPQSTTGMPVPGTRSEATGLHPMPSRAESSGPRPKPDLIANRLGGDEEAPKSVPTPARPEKREEIDPMCLTTEMEAIGDDVKKRREVDHTLARFSAVHDELLEQERQRKERRSKLMPWRNEEGEEATQFAEPATMFVEPEEEERPAGRTPQQRKMMRMAKVTAIAAAALVFVSTGVGWAAKLWVDNKFQKIDALGGNSAAVQQAEKQLGDENFLIVGSDTRAGAKAGDNVGTQAQEPGARSDVVMLAHIPKDRKRVVVVSLPRDVEIDLPACEKWDANTGQLTGEKAPPQKGVKANEAYANGGPRCVTDLMTQLTGLKINHFVSIDFNGFRNMSTAVGGVKVCVSKPMIDDELGSILPKAGQHEISGDLALKYVRARKVNGEVFGDYDRITRQQQFLSAMLRQALSSEVLLNPSKLNNFINAFAQSTAGDNVGVDQLLTLGQSLQGLEAGRVSFVTMPHVTDDMQLKDDPSDNVERLKSDEVKALFQSIIDGTPLPLEKQDPNSKPDPTAPAKAGAVIAPNQVSVQVLNGDTENGGAAGRTRTALEKQGFKVVNVGDTASAPKTIIKYSKGREDWAETLKAAIPSAEKVEDPSMGGAVVVVLGANFDDKVVAPQAGESAKPDTPGDLSIVNGAQDPCAK